MPRLPAISLSAPAISSAWPRLSSTQGPAISASGRRLPKRTAPTATIALDGTAVGAVIDTSPEPADHERMRVRGQHADAVPGPLTTALVRCSFGKQHRTYGWPTKPALATEPRPNHRVAKGAILRISRNETVLRVYHGDNSVGHRRPDPGSPLRTRQF